MMSLSQFTADVSLGKLNEANDIVTMNISPSNGTIHIDKIKEGGDDAETIPTRKRLDQSTTKSSSERCV
jgi:hypothetical protein